MLRNMFQIAEGDLPEYCFIFLPGVCAKWGITIQYWEVVFSAVISAIIAVITILISIRMAEKTAMQTISRELELRRITRRGRMLIHFADYCALMIASFREGKYSLGVIYVFSAQMFAHVTDAERDALEWMKDVIAEIQAAGAAPLKALVAKPAEDVSELEMLNARSEAEKLAAHAFGARVDDLRGWVHTELAWPEYLRHVGAEPVVGWETRMREDEHPEAALFSEQNV